VFLVEVVVGEVLFGWCDFRWCVNLSCATIRVKKGGGVFLPGGIVT